MSKREEIIQRLRDLDVPDGEIRRLLAAAKREVVRQLNVEFAEASPKQHYAPGMYQEAARNWKKSGQPELRMTFITNPLQPIRSMRLAARNEGMKISSENRWKLDGRVIFRIESSTGRREA